MPNFSFQVSEMTTTLNPGKSVVLSTLLKVPPNQNKELVKFSVAPDVKIKIMSDEVFSIQVMINVHFLSWHQLMQLKLVLSSSK